MKVAGRGGAVAIEHLRDRGVDHRDTLMLAGTSIIARSVRGLFPYKLSDLTLVCLFLAEILTFAVRGDSTSSLSPTS